jgi:ribosomal protein S18 acetylase RimI-like enzyme
MICMSRTPQSSSSTFAFRDVVLPQDLASIRDIAQSTDVFHPWEVDIAVELAEERLTKGAASGYSFLFADCQGSTDGWVCWGEIPCTRGSYDVYWIAVRKSSQGKGLGRQLMLLAEQHIQLQGGRHIYLETSGRPDYLPTRRFYEHCHYRIAAELPDFYATGDAKVIYVKVLDQLPEPSNGSVAAGHS